jgi:hypothetical protein
MCKGGQVLNFNKTVCMPKGILFVLILNQRMTDQQATKSEDVKNRTIEQELLCKEEYIAVATRGNKAITINKAHAMCGHMNQVKARGVCNY